MSVYIPSFRLSEIAPTHSGSVEWYSATKRCGVIRGDDGEAVFFHRSQNRAFWLGKKRVKFHSAMDEPLFIRVGDRVVFALSDQDRTPRDPGSLLWGYEHAFHAMLEEMRHRPLMQLVRHAVVPSEDGDRVERAVLWRGRDIASLRKRFQVRPDGTDPVSDLTLPDGMRSLGMLLEELMPDGAWVRMHHAQQEALLSEDPRSPKRMRFASYQTTTAVVIEAEVEAEPVSMVA